MKILIVGAGAMGCYMGAVLTAAGQDVILYDVDIAKMVLLDCQGIYLEELDGGLQIIRPQTREKIEVIEPVDVVIFWLKDIIPMLPHRVLPLLLIVSRISSRCKTAWVIWRSSPNVSRLIGFLPE